MGRKKASIGDVFSFDITDEIIEILKIQPDDIFSLIKDIYYKIPRKIGYGIVINKKDHYILIQIKKVDKDNPTLNEIQESNTIYITWAYENILWEKEYKVLGNLPMEPIMVNKFWLVGGNSWDNFMAGNDVELKIVQVEGFDVPKRIGFTNDINIIKQLYRYNGLGTYATVMMNFIQNYYRDENNIETLIW